MGPMRRDDIVYHPGCTHPTSCPASQSGHSAHRISIRFPRSPASPLPLPPSLARLFCLAPPVCSPCGAKQASTYIAELCCRQQPRIIPFSPHTRPPSNIRQHGQPNNRGRVQRHREEHHHNTSQREGGHQCQCSPRWLYRVLSRRGRRPWTRSHAQEVQLEAVRSIPRQQGRLVR